MNKLKEEIESLKKDDKATLLIENEQLKADNVSIQKGSICSIVVIV